MPSSLAPSSDTVLTLLIMGLVPLSIFCCLVFGLYQSFRTNWLSWYWRALTLLSGTGIALTIAVLEFIDPVDDSGEMPPLMGAGVCLILLGVAGTLLGAALGAWRKTRPPCGQTKQPAAIESN